MVPRISKTGALPSMKLKTQTKSGFKCKYCLRKFSNLQNLRVHVSSHAERKFVCSYCPNSFKRNDTRAVHERIHTGYKPYICKYCEKRFVQQTQLNIHLQRHDRLAEDYKSNNNNNHRRKNSVPKLDVNKQIRKCASIIKSDGFLNVRLEKDPQNSRVHVRHVSSQADRKFVCFYCPNSYKRKWDCEVHQRMHEGQRPYKCKYCEQSFVTKSHLGKHLRRHIGLADGQSNNFKVEVYNLNVRSEKNPYVCKHCRQRFPLEKSLDDHLLTHLEEQPYECAFCGKRATQKYNLERHLWRHCESKPFECPTCNSSFDDGPNFHGHLKAHLVHHPYKCKICPYSASRKDYITKHEKIHPSSNVKNQSDFTNSQRNHQDSKIAFHKLSPVRTNGQYLLLQGLKSTVQEFAPFQNIQHYSLQDVKETFKGVSVVHKKDQRVLLRNMKEPVKENNFQESNKYLVAPVAYRKRFKCKICFYSVPRKEYLRRHEKKHRRHKDCEEVSKVQEDDQELTLDLKEDETDASKYSCKECSVMFSTNEELCLHYSAVHNLPALVLTRLPLNFGDVVVIDCEF